MLFCEDIKVIIMRVSQLIAMLCVREINAKDSKIWAQYQ